MVMRRDASASEIGEGRNGKRKGIGNEWGGGKGEVAQVGERKWRV